MKRVGLALLSMSACFAEPSPTQTDPDDCEPGVVRACFCETGGAGAQTCADDGSGYSTCSCPDGDTTTVAADPTDGASSSSSGIEPADSSTTDTSEACTHRVFVTVATFTGALGPGRSPFADADAVCTAEAVAAGLGGEWVAVLSDAETFAASRIEICGEVVLANDGSGSVGPTIATLTTWWSPQHTAPISRHADGTLADGTAWTGTRLQGDLDPASCSSWTIAREGPVGTFGVVTATDNTWVDNDGSCSEPRRLYCIERQSG